MGCVLSNLAHMKKSLFPEKVVGRKKSRGVAHTLCCEVLSRKKKLKITNKKLDNISDENLYSKFEA